MLNRLFQLDQHRTTVGRELQAGLTTFAAMAYILAVNPAILAETGMDKAALVTVTALTAAVATLLMALLTNYPIALAPGMGINAFFTYTICIGRGVPWTEALGMVFVNGVLFLGLSITGIRERIITAIPHALKIAVTAGIGLFIAFLGLKNGGIIVAHPATLVTHGNFASGPVALCLAGIAFTAILVARRVPGAIVLGIVAVTVTGLFVRAGGGQMVTELPESIVAAPASPAPVFLKLTFQFLTNRHAILLALPLVLTLLLVDLFDNIGTLVAVTKRAGFLRPDGTLPKAGRALLADSLATILSAVAGTSTVLAVAGLAIAAGFYLWRAWSSERLAAALPWLHQALARKLYVDDAYQAVIDYGALAMGKAIATFDRVFINDVGINGPGRLAVVAGGWLKLTQTGKVANYALGMIAGLLITVAAVLTFFV